MTLDPVRVTSSQTGSGPARRRSLFVTISAWTVIGLSALMLPISCITVLMILARSHGTSTWDPLGFFVIVILPSVTLAVGVGVLLRCAWARYALIALLACIIAHQAWALLTARATTTTTTSPTGLVTTTTTSGPNFATGVPIILACSLLLAGYLTPPVRAEFTPPPAVSPPELPHWEAPEFLESDTSTPNDSGIAPESDARTAPATPSPQPTTTHAARPPTHYSSASRIAPTTRTAKQTAALRLSIVLLLAIACFMGWLVAAGLSRGTTHFPAPKSTQRRTVTRHLEPVTFWISVGIYATLGLGTGGLALWFTRESLR